MAHEPGEGSLRVARQIADGEPVDWEAVRGDPEVSDYSEGFRVLEAIASAHRRAALEAPAAAIPAPAEMEQAARRLESQDFERAAAVPAADLSKADTGPDPEPSPAAPAFPWRWGPLEVRELIGQGGFGEIYRAHDPELDREVALKLLRPGRARDRRASRNFIKEARRHARVKNPHIVTIHGAGVHGGRAGIWMELIRGKNLEEILREQGRFSAVEAASIGIQMCSALAAVHEEGLIHRDMKTANIMRDEGGSYVLMDFSASIDAPSPGNGTHREPATGTLLFMAPELLEGADADTCADTYALGVVLYRLVTGGFPVHAGSLSELREKHRRGEVTRLRDARADLPGAFIQVVEQALCRQPGGGCKTPGELEQALKGFLNLPPREPAPVPPVPWLSRLWKDHPLRAAMSATAVLVLAIGAAWWLLRPGLRVEADLFRMVAGGAQERLVPGARVGVGDALFLEIEGSREMYVYVIEKDDKGSQTFLFPSGDFDLQNPLPGGEVHTLPGTRNGEPFLWTIDTAGGRERILVVASVEPVEELEEWRQRIPAVVAQAQPAPEEPLPHERGADAEREVTRGMETARPAEEIAPQAPNSSAIDEILPGITDRAASASGLWYWSIMLEARRDASAP